MVSDTKKDPEIFVLIGFFAFETLSMIALGSLYPSNPSVTVSVCPSRSKLLRPDLIPTVPVTVLVIAKLISTSTGNCNFRADPDGMGLLGISMN